MSTYLELSKVSKGYGSGEARTEVLENMNLKVEKGEFLAIVGYSGTGKTTLMNLLAGLIAPDQGAVVYKGKEVDGPNPERGLVFQNYSLLPWLTVEGNVELAVNEVFSNESAEERRKRVHDAVEMVNLTPALAKRPGELSGGMRQRTSVARTLSTRPELLLLDEPLSALDALTRSVIQDQILDIWEAMNQTIILITNDVDEGLYMADRIIPLSLGPNATFGPELQVDIPRPRDRKSMNHDPRYKEMRNEIINYLLAQKEEEFANSTARPVSLPNVKPKDLSQPKGFTLFGNKKKEVPAEAVAL
ncbi:MAG: ABC transporter ATP-binding protein [Verrucomicrobiota bacterium]